MLFPTSQHHILCRSILLNYNLNALYYLTTRKCEKQSDFLLFSGNIIISHLVNTYKTFCGVDDQCSSSPVQGTNQNILAQRTSRVKSNQEEVGGP